MITLTSPAQGQTFAHGETITINADAADSDDGITDYWSNPIFGRISQ